MHGGVAWSDLCVRNETLLGRDKVLRGKVEEEEQLRDCSFLGVKQWWLGPGWQQRRRRGPVTFRTGFGGVTCKTRWRVACGCRGKGRNQGWLPDLSLGRWVNNGSGHQNAKQWGQEQVHRGLGCQVLLGVLLNLCASGDGTTERTGGGRGRHRGEKRQGW